MTQPVHSAFNANATIGFTIEGLREQVVSMFTLREESLRAAVQKALDSALSQDNVQRMIDAEVAREVRNVFEREIHVEVSRAVTQRCGSVAFQKKIAERVKQELELADKYGTRMDT